MPPKRIRPKGTTPPDEPDAEEPEFEAPPDMGPPEGYTPPPAPHPESEIPKEALESASKFFVYGVVILHEKVADWTRYDGFQLTDSEKEMWDYVAKELIPLLPLRYAILIMVAFSLTIAEGSKIAGYLQYQQALKNQQRPPSQPPPEV